MIIPKTHSKHHLTGHITLEHNSHNSTPLSGKSTHADSRIQLNASQQTKKIENYSITLIGYITDVLDTTYSRNDCQKSPEQLAIQLFKKYRERFTAFLEGSFLIVIHDTKTNDCYLCNNRYQATTCYYTVHNGTLFFASSLKLLIATLPYVPEFDPRSLPSFLHTGFSHTEKTQLAGIQRLLPTQHLCVHNETVRITDHWDTEFTFDRRPISNTAQHLDTYETLFSKSIEQFLETTKPSELGCFVSGGHDTSYIFIQAAKLFNKPIHAFTASFKNFGFDESPKSRYLTEKFGGIHHPVYIGPESIDYIPHMINCIEEPVSGGSFPIFACVFEAHKHVNAMLSGDAGDSLWGEYYPVCEWHKYLHALPLSIRKMIKHLNTAARKWTDWERLWESEQVFSLFSEKDMYHNFFSRLCTYRHYDMALMRELLTPDVFNDITPYDCMIHIPVHKDNLHDALVETKMLYGLYQYMVPPTQKPLEAFGIDYYAPYLNHSLISFINQLPEEWLNGGSSFQKLINDAHRRKFHKQAMLKYLPKRYVYSAQQSLDVPFHSFLTKRPVVLEKLLARLKKRGFFNEKTLNRLFYEFPRQKVKPHEILELKHHGYRLFCLLTFEIWHMQFVDNPNGIHTPQVNIPPLEEYLSL